MNEFDLTNATAWIVLIIVLGALFADIRIDLCKLVSGRNVVLLAILAWYVLEAIMLPNALRRYDQETYNAGILYVAIASILFLIGYHGTKGCWLFPTLGKSVSFLDDRKWLWRLMLVGAAIGFSPVIYYTGTQVAEMLSGILGMRATWGGILGRGRYGDARAAFLMLEWFITGVSPFAYIVLFGRASTLLQRIVAFLVVGWPMLRAYGSGTRSALVVEAGALVAVIYWSVGMGLRKKIISIALICTPILYGLMAAFVASRGAGELSWEAGQKTDYVGNEMFRELLFIISKVPENVEYQLGYVYYVQLVNPIPRFLWPDKPTLDSGLLMAALYGEVDARGEAYLTISPGLIGEMYLNFGVLGIMGLSFFGGWLVKGWDRIAHEYADSLPAMVFYSGGLAVLFLMGRSFTMSMFYGLLSFAALAWTFQYFGSHDRLPGVNNVASSQPE